MAHLNLIVIKTNRLQEQFKFYSLLGIEFDYHNHGNGPFHYASVSQNPVIEIYPLPKGIAQPDTTTRLGFAVGKLDLVIQNFKSKGIKIISEPATNEWGYLNYFQFFNTIGHRQFLRHRSHPVAEFPASGFARRNKSAPTQRPLCQGWHFAQSGSRHSGKALRHPVLLHSHCLENDLDLISFCH